MTDHKRLQALLGGPETAWLLERLRKKLRNGTPLSGTISLRDPSAAQRDAIEGLLSRRPGFGRLSVRLEEVDAVLRSAEICKGLAEAAAILLGPVPNLRQAALARKTAFANIFLQIERQRMDDPFIHTWLEDLQTGRLFIRLSKNDPRRGQKLADQILTAMSLLPAQEVLLPHFAVQIAGDAHALDRGKPLGNLLVRYAAKMAETSPPEDAVAWRETWDAVGIICDELSTPVLTLNLPATGDKLTDHALRLHAESGEPYRLSVRQLKRLPPTFCGHRCTVFICENPAVLAAAANKFGPLAPPMICLEGQPKSAGRLLMNLLGQAGQRLVYHGDFDWPGIRIANLVLDQHRAEPWRMSAADYLTAAKGIPLHGPAETPHWDSDLEAAMTRRGTAIHEELVLDQLLEDLSPHHSTSP